MALAAMTSAQQQRGVIHRGFLPHHADITIHIGMKNVLIEHSWPALGTIPGQPRWTITLFGGERGWEGE
jgi:hypothetical protein